MAAEREKLESGQSAQEAKFSVKIQGSAKPEDCEGLERETQCNCSTCLLFSL